MKANLVLQENTNGTDWVVGDIHGCLKELLWGLNRIGFDKTKDRLLCSGDLIDRGDDSFGVVKLLDEPWFYSTRGNHEDMCLDAYAWPSWSAGSYRLNGGDWFYDLTPQEQDEVVMRLSGLPLTIFVNVDTIDGPENILLIHARVPEDEGWCIHLREATEFKDIPPAYIQDAIWNRHMSVSFLTEQVDGIDTVCVGHTPQPTPKRLKNYLCMDTGVVYNPQGQFVFYNTKTKQIV